MYGCRLGSRIPEVAKKNTRSSVGRKIGRKADGRRKERRTAW